MINPFANSKCYKIMYNESFLYLIPLYYRTIENKLRLNIESLNVIIHVHVIYK